MQNVGDLGLLRLLGELGEGLHVLRTRFPDNIPDFLAGLVEPHLSQWHTTKSRVLVCVCVFVCVWSRPATDHVLGRISASRSACY